MARKINLDPGLLRFAFEDNDGNEYSSFHINPSDMQLGKRLMELQKFFETADLKLESDELEEMAHTEEIVHEQLNKLLGYDCTEEAFGTIGALTVLPDGSFFFEHFIDLINEEVPKAMEARAKKSEEHMARYTKAYEAEGDEGV